MLVFEGTLLIVFELGSKARNDLEYRGDHSRFVHCPDEDEEVFMGEKNDFACSIKAGFSSVLKI